MNTERLLSLFERLDQDDFTMDEIEELNNWYHSLNTGSNDLKKWFEEAGGEEILAERMYSSFRNKNIQIKSQHSTKRILQVAAALILLTSVVFYTFLNKQDQKNKNAGTSKVSPAQINAHLTLADGSVVNVNDLSLGTTSLAGALLEKTKDGRLIYKVDPKISSNKFNTISTPRAGQFEVVLSDGTRVWLNAASSLCFPLKFDGKERVVSLKGEGYFEVAHDKMHPFKVNSGLQTVTVLGTHFNVKAYSEEHKISTTLFSGSVNVRDNRNAKQELLKPGKQSEIQEDRPGIALSNADLDQALSWKNGYFIFDNQNVKTIMTLISRWYDVDIEYHISSEEYYGGTFSRTSDLNELLKNLESLGKTKFQLKERKIIVSN